MLQFMLPLVEFGLLVATLFFYWQTRRVLNEARLNQTSPSASAAESAASVKELTALLAELQTISEAARRDWKSQYNILDEKIQQADEKVEALQALLQQADGQADIHVEARPAQTVLSRRLDDGIAQFKAELLAAGRSPNTTERAVSIAREFCGWLTEQQRQEPALQNISGREIEQYISMLRQQDYRPETFKRKKTALHIFWNWLEQQSATASKPYAYVAVKRPEDNRNQLVLSMAHQGMDRQAIAAKTGIEQEAVRLMLMMNTAAYQ